MGYLDLNEKEAKGSHYHMNGKDTITELYEENAAYGRGFCYGNIKKYLKRLGKKGSTPEERAETEKKDLYKIANYAIIMLAHEYGEYYKLVKVDKADADN